MPIEASQSYCSYYTLEVRKVCLDATYCYHYYHPIFDYSSELILVPLFDELIDFEFFSLGN